jgi:hypothetical protein
MARATRPSLPCACNGILQGNLYLYGFCIFYVLMTFPQPSRGELNYLAPLGSEKISAPYFKQCFFRGGGGGFTPQAESNTTPPSPKREITNILFYILNFASIIKFKM